MKVRITELEYLHAAHAGFFRQAYNVLEERRDANGFKGDGYAAHVVGALGEFAVAKGLQLFWAGPGKLRHPDVGKLQVRATPVPKGCLILHPADNEDEAFVLVIAPKMKPLEYELVGWLRGRPGKQPRFWTDPVGGRAAYFVPQAELAPIETLMEKDPANGK